MGTVATFFELGVLWLFITYYTGSTDSDKSYGETWIVFFGTALAGLVATWVLRDSSPVLVGAIKLGALYFLVSWACGTERKVTLKICGWYLLIMIISGVASEYLMKPAPCSGGSAALHDRLISPVPPAPNRLAGPDH